jgi:hypothetical protein
MSTYNKKATKIWCESTRRLVQCCEIFFETKIMPKGEALCAGVFIELLKKSHQEKACVNNISNS